MLHFTQIIYELHSLRKYAPHQVIESITESDMSNLFPNTERIAKFYENHLKTLSPTQEETMKIKNRFGKDEFQNMIEWMVCLDHPSYQKFIHTTHGNFSSNKRKNGKTAGMKCLEMKVTTIAYLTITG